MHGVVPVLCWWDWVVQIIMVLLHFSVSYCISSLFLMNFVYLAGVLSIRV